MKTEAQKALNCSSSPPVLDIMLHIGRIMAVAPLDEAMIFELLVVAKCNQYVTVAHYWRTSQGLA